MNANSTKKPAPADNEAARKRAESTMQGFVMSALETLKSEPFALHLHTQMPADMRLALAINLANGMATLYAAELPRPLEQRRLKPCKKN